LQFNILPIFSEICLQAVLIGVQRIIETPYRLYANCARNRSAIRTQNMTSVDSPLVLKVQVIPRSHLSTLNVAAATKEGRKEEQETSTPQLETSCQTCVTVKVRVNNNNNDDDAAAADRDILYSSSC
jgi:hypothetical protein